jgi:hypothetical protein
MPACTGLGTLGFHEPQGGVAHGLAGERTVMADINEFLNPKSMLTPGFAGAATMMITNAVANALQLPNGHKGIPVTALTVSLLFGLLAFTSTAVPVWQRTLYWLLNSLIIFSMAVGTNRVGGIATGAVSGTLQPSVAYAQVPPAGGAAPANARAAPAADGQATSAQLAQFFKDWFQGQAVLLGTEAEACSQDRLRVIGSRGEVVIPAGQSSRLISVSSPTVSWSCGDSRAQTVCPAGTTRVAIQRTKEQRFYVQCWQ